MKRAIYLSLLLPFLWIINSEAEIIELSEWKYFKGLSKPDTDISWFSVDFDDTDWLIGECPFGFGEGDTGTVLSDMWGNYTSFYLRTTFTDTSNIEKLSFIYDFDDGFVLYLNGVVLISHNAPAEPSFNSVSTALSETGISDTFSILMPQDLILEDENVIAVQVFNIGINSRDAYFDLKLEAKLPMPQAAKPFLDIQGGIYKEPITVNVYPLMEGDSVYYTMDGSDPARSANAVLCTSKTEIKIDPSILSNRGNTPGVVLSMKTIRAGYRPSPLVSNTYLFIDKVKTQGSPGWLWPSERINGQIFDYEMDREIVNDPRYKDSIDLALQAIPSLMLTMDYNDLFDEDRGIYVNADHRGIEWERPGNLELISAEGKQEFRVGLGVRMRGGSSRGDRNPKHSFRFFFRSEYGNGKLNYPMFGDEGADNFDKLDLRTAQNYSWSFKGSNLNTMNRDVFSRDIQRDMNQPYTRSRYYHLYINGLYYGVYQTQERSEARFAETYLGGDAEDYDVVKVARDNGKRIEATDGNLDAWQQVYDLCETGFADMDNYYRILGKDKNGVRDTSIPVLIDEGNLIDYMMTIFITGNYDAPVSQFFKNDAPNNYYAIYDHEDQDEGFKFFAHDSEHTLKSITRNRVNIAHLDDNPMEKPAFEFFHPQWVHYRLSQNTEYRMRFADRAYDLLYNDGVLTPTENRKRFMKTADVLSLPIMAESARWGDAKNENPLNKEDHWVPAISYIADTYFKERTDIVIQQLKDEGLLPIPVAPKVFENNVELLSDKSGLSYSSIEIRNPNAAGELLYTLNGEDPRQAGGVIFKGAETSNHSTTLEIETITFVKSRIWMGGEWSPLRKLFLVPKGYSMDDLQLTEIHYHPMDSLGYSGKQLEFIELKNSGDDAIDLMGISLDKGIKYTFNEHCWLKPDSFVVLASDADAFFDRYGQLPQGEYKKSLSNGGEALMASDALGNTLFEVVYNDKSPWPTRADGEGYSMVPYEVDQDIDPAFFYYWRNSYYMGGSPFADDVVLVSNQPRIEDSEFEFQVFPNPVSKELFIQNNRMEGDRVSVEIYSLNGRLLLRSGMKAQQTIKIDLEHYGLESGIYLLKILSGTRIQTTKLMIRK